MKSDKCWVHDNIIYFLYDSSVEQLRAKNNFLRNVVKEDGI